MPFCWFMCLIIWCMLSYLWLNVTCICLLYLCNVTYLIFDLPVFLSLSLYIQITVLRFPIFFSIKSYVLWSNTKDRAIQDHWRLSANHLWWSRYTRRDCLPGELPEISLRVGGELYHLNYFDIIKYVIICAGCIFSEFNCHFLSLAGFKKVFFAWFVSLKCHLCHWTRPALDQAKLSASLFPAKHLGRHFVFFLYAISVRRSALRWRRLPALESKCGSALCGQLGWTTWHFGETWGESPVGF